MWLVLAIVVALLLVGVIVAYARRDKSGKVQGSIIRSWMAMALVLGLLIFSAATFAVPDQSMRNMMVGALATSAGSVITFYFTTRSAEAARQDVVQAATRTETNQVRS